jgi:monoamine oxidase
LRCKKTTVVDADYVVPALPFTVLRDVELAASLPAGLRRLFARLTSDAFAKASGFSEKVWRRDEGFIVELWGDLGFSEVCEETQRQRLRGDGALTFYTGGREADAVVGKSADHIGRAFVHRWTRRFTA